MDKNNVNDDIKEFSCNFIFSTTVQTNGRDADGAISNINRILDEDIIKNAESIMGCGIGYEDDIQVKEVENGWFELVLVWSGSWDIESKTKLHAKEITEEILDKKLTPFYQMLENLSDNGRHFAFKGLKNAEVIDIVKY